LDVPTEGLRLVGRPAVRTSHCPRLRASGRRRHRARRLLLL